MTVALTRLVGRDRPMALVHAILLVVAVLAVGTGACAELASSGFDVAPLAVSSGEYGPISEPPPGVSTNPTGDVAFVGPTGAGDALFLRDSFGVTVKIIAAGDPLAGGMVRRLVAMPNSLDAYRQVTFYATLADGRTGIFRASPPPGAFLVSPAWGYRDRPLTFHLTGDGFTPGTRVRFGTAEAGFVSVSSRTELTGVIPPGAPAGVVDVTTSRPGGGERTLERAFEFRDPPASGCRGFWPDHRPPDVTASSVVSSWLLPSAVLVAPAMMRRWRGRSRRAGRQRR